MALSGLEIYKHLPKSNCKECGLPTCLAFAMKVAGGQTTLDACPRLEDAARASLGEASAPPQQLVTIGAGDQAVQVGQEMVLFRHEDKFYHPTAIAVSVNDNLDDAALEKRCQDIAAISIERMGKTSRVELVALVNASGDAQRFAAAAKIAVKAAQRPLALMSADAAALKSAGAAIADTRPLLWAMDAASNLDAAIEAAKELSLPLCIEGGDFDAIAGLTEKAKAAGLKELVLSPGRVDPASGLTFLSQTRRAAIQKKFRPVGYPVAMLAMDEDAARAAADACWYVLKYAGIVVTDRIEPEYLVTMFASRQDIYTNPQVPVQVESGVHPVNEPDADSPLLITTNFALSYYSVESEVASSRIPTYILAVDTEGTSVLTAWAAEKLTAASVSEGLTKSGLADKLSHKKMVIPGLVAVLSASIKDESGWEVMVGPREASGVAMFLKSQWKP